MEGENFGDGESGAIRVGDLEREIRVRVAGDNHLKLLVDGRGIFDIVGVVACVLQSKDMGGGVLGMVGDSVFSEDGDSEKNKEEEVKKSHW